MNSILMEKMMQSLEILYKLCGVRVFLYIILSSIVHKFKNRFKGFKIMYVEWVSENSVVFWRGRIYTDLTNVNGVWGNLELRFKSED